MANGVTLSRLWQLPESASSWENGDGSVAPVSWMPIRREQVDVQEGSGIWEKLSE